MEALAAQSVTLPRRLLAGILLLAVFAAPALADKGKKWFEEARKAEARTDLDAALANYEKAASLEPANIHYRADVYRLRFTTAMSHVNKGVKLRDSGDLDGALKEFTTAYRLDPSNVVASEQVRQTMTAIEARKAGNAPELAMNPRELALAETQARMAELEGPPQLIPSSRSPVSLHATNEARILFETVGKLAGINVLFDPDYKLGSRITLDLNNVTLEQALDNLAALTRSYWKSLTNNTILIYNEQRRRDLDPMVMKTFYLTNINNPSEITEIAQMMRTLLMMTRVQQINAQNAIVVRDTIDKVALAEKIVYDLDKAKPEVLVDVAVLAVARDFSRTIGLFPGSPGITFPVAFAPGGRSTTTTSGTGTDTTGATTTTTTTGSSGGFIPLSRLNRLSTNDWAATLPGATLNLLMSDSRTRLLQNPQVRATDGQPAKLRIGQRIPIATGSFQPGIGGVGINPLVNTQFQYTDVGVILEITPRMNGDREVSMKIIIEISAVDSFTNIGGISQPIIGQRRIEEEIRLREGEVNLIGGIIQSQSQNSLAGIPGVSQVPLLKYLFSNNVKTTSESEVMIVLTPRIVRLPNITALNLRAIDAGSETNPAIRTRSEVTAPPLARPATPPATAAPGAGTIAPGVPAPGGIAPAAPGTASPGTPPTIQPPTAPPTAQPGVPGATPLGTPPPNMPPETTAPVTTPTQPGPPSPDEEASRRSRSQLAALRFDSVGYTANASDRFNVTLLLDNAQNLQSVPLQLQYDPKEIKLVDILNGDFLGRDGQAVGISQVTDEQQGTATVVLTRPPGSAGVSGSGVLAILSFQAIGKGDAALRIQRSFGRDSSGGSVSIAGTQARVVVR